VLTGIQGNTYRKGQENSDNQKINKTSHTTRKKGRVEVEKNYLSSICKGGGESKKE